MEYIRESNMTLTKGMTQEMIENAIGSGRIFCGKALIYESGKGLHFNLNGIKGLMPKEEVLYTADGSSPKDAAIITRINKNVCFEIIGITDDASPVAILSRRNVQKRVYDEYISQLIPGDVIPCCITHVDSFGVFCDIGCGVNALIPIDFISVSRISSPADRFTVGQNIFACVKSISPDGKIVLTHKELLGTWLENAAMFTPHTTVCGIVRSIEDYGVFIELSPNLAGLAEADNDVAVGDVVRVYIKSILPNKMKVKLVILGKETADAFNNETTYFITDGHIDSWRYSTDSGIKNIYTDFTI